MNEPTHLSTEYCLRLWAAPNRRSYAFSFRDMRAFRLVQILPVLKVALVTAGIVLYLAAVGIWIFGRDAQPEAFGSVFHCLWWAVATKGHVFTGLIPIVGLAVVAIPTGLVSAALMREDDRGVPEDEGDRGG